MSPVIHHDTLPQKNGGSSLSTTIRPRGFSLRAKTMAGKIGRLLLPIIHWFKLLYYSTHIETVFT